MPTGLQFPEPSVVRHGRGGADCRPSTSGRCLTFRPRTCHRLKHQCPVQARAAGSERATNWSPALSGSMPSVDTATAEPPSNVKTFASFDQMIEESDLPVLVDFHAHWCGPCQMMGHVISSLSKRLEGAVICVRIDCDKYPALASRYQVQALPTLVLFKDGKPIDKVEGYVNLQSLLDRVNYYLGRRMGPGRRFRPGVVSSR